MAAEDTLSGATREQLWLRPVTEEAYQIYDDRNIMAIVLSDLRGNLEENPAFHGEIAKGKVLLQ